MTKILITATGNKVGPETLARIANGLSRRIDTYELARTFNADMIQYQEARYSGLISALLAQAGLNSLSLAWACFTRRSTYQVIFAAGEDIGLPLALLLKYLAFLERKRPHLMMVAHDILSPKKKIFFHRFGLQSRITNIFLFSELQRTELLQRFKLSQAQLVTLSFMVDARFFSQDAPGLTVPPPKSRPQVCAIGIEARDYPTLMQAAAGLDLDVIIAASSPWSHVQDSSRTMDPPPNVQINRDLSVDVRQLYMDSDFVVVPLYDIERAAGSTTILEAMAMGKAVICSRARGQQSLVVDGETGIYVPPGDVAAMRQAIQFMLDHPDERQRMGSAGRRRVEQGFTLEHYVEQISNYMRCSVSDSSRIDGVALSPRGHSTP